MKTLILAFMGILCVAQARAERVNDAEIAYYHPRLIIVVNKAQKGTALHAQTLEAFVDGELLYRATVSTAKEKKVFIQPNKKYPEGHEYLASTYEGTFRIDSRDIDHTSDKWGGSPMKFAQFFDGGIAIHATVDEHYPDLGTRASGGCVRLYIRDAKIMWGLVDKVGVDQTRIIVYDGSVREHPLGRPDDAPRFTLSKAWLLPKKIVTKPTGPVEGKLN